MKAGTVLQFVLLTALLVLHATNAAAHDGTRISVQLSGVEDDIAENVLAHLDLVRFSDRDDLSEAAVERLLEAAPEQVRQALRPFGYYNPGIEHSLSEENGRLIARLAIDPGEQVRLGEVNVQIRGPGSDHSRLQNLLVQSPLVVGQPLVHHEYDELRAELQRTARSLGYFDHRLVRQRLAVDPDEDTARVTLILDTGERYLFGEVDFEQDILAPSVAEQLVYTRQGEPYDADDIILTQFSLADSGYFANVIVQPGERDNDALTVPVRIEADAAPRHRLIHGIGYGTDTQLRLRAGWEINRLNRQGHQARLDARLSEVLVDVVGQYIIPVRDPLTQRLIARAAYVDEELADLDSSRVTVGINRERLMGDWQRNVFADVVRERTRLPGRPAFTDTLVVPGIGVERLDVDDPVLPSEGHRLYAELRGSHRVLGSGTDFLRAQIGGDYLTSVDEDEEWSVLLQAALGMSWVHGFDGIPGSQRFFAGGDESVRGYRYNGLAQRDGQGRIVGGRHLVFGSVEVRRALGNWLQVAGFVDGGNALMEIDDGLQVSVGAGVHVMTPLGRLRLEVARPITEGRRFRLHVSIRPDL